MQELLRDPVIQQARLLPDYGEGEGEDPLDQLTVSTATKNQPIQVSIFLEMFIFNSY